MVTQFFDYYQTPPLYQRIRMASFHMEGEALVWFQDADEAGQFPTWDSFLQALQTRFGPAYDDPMESLMKLRQSSTVGDYTAQFEALSNRLRGLSEANRLSCFLSGLKDEIRLPLRMLKPQNLVAAFGLAKLQEEYFLSTRRSSLPNRSSSTYGRQQPWSSSTSSSAQHLYQPVHPVPTAAKPTASIPVQHITPAQMRERREKGLCYNCEEKWNPAHRCKFPKLFLMHGLELHSDDKLDEVYFDSSDGVEPILDPTLQDDPVPAISLHAISGSLSPNTMRLVGLINNQQVVILIDLGSTHSFLDPAVLKTAQLKLISTPTLKVQVANGATIQSEGRCSSVPIKVQGNLILTDLYVIPLGGCDVVLGVTWLRTLGPILWDFWVMTMQYSIGT